MPKNQAKQAYGDVIDAINQFLAAPPEGTPSEILKAFGMLDSNGLLPPQLFLEAVEQAPVAISITDSSACILYANSAFERLTGYGREEVIGCNESMLSSKATPVSVYQGLWRTIQSRQVWRGKLVNHRKGGAEYLAELTISPVLDPHGDIAYFLGMHRDITEVHALQQRLEFQKSLIEVALDAAPMVVAMLDGSGKPLLDNHAYKALLGDFRGQEPTQLILDALKSQTGCDPRETGEDFTNYEVSVNPPNSSGPRWFVCSGVHIKDFDPGARSFFEQPVGSRCRLLLIANEVTGSRKRINEARMNMIRTSMAEQQMVQTMHESISAAIFKLQAPINITRAALSMSAGNGERSSLQPVLQQVLDTGEDAMESLHNALPGTRSEQTVSININELLHEVLYLSTDQLLASGIVVDWRPSPVLPALVGRPNALRAMFKYLIDNAIESLNESRQDMREMRLETAAEAGEITISFMDNGIGIPQSESIKVFEPFFCGWENPRDHAGMGLTMAQEVAIGHDGSVEVDRQFAGGCRLFVHLPYRVAKGDSNGPG